MFGRSKKEELQEHVDESKRMLLRYSNMVRTIAEEFGSNELPKLESLTPKLPKLCCDAFLPLAEIN
jgi:hypothetical protein